MQEDPQPLTAELAERMEEAPADVRLAKSQVLSIRLSDNELRQIASEARRAGMKVGVFIKKAAMEAAEAKRFSAAPQVTFGLGTSGIAYSGLPSAQRADVAADKVELSLQQRVA